jgi:hypothetical protein
MGTIKRFEDFGNMERIPEALERDHLSGHINRIEERL